jgi:AcrR family transcriptional regulator
LSATDITSERAKIVAAAYRLLTASDGASVPITDILAAAGLSTRAFYRHFDSKDALLLAMFRSDSDRVLGQLSAIAADSATAREGLERWIGNMLALTADPRRRRRVLVLSSDEVTRARGYRAELERYHADQDEAIAALLRRGLADGSLPRSEPERDARYIRAAIHAAFDGLMARRLGGDVDDAVRSLVDFVLRSLEAAAAVPVRSPAAPDPVPPDEDRAGCAVDNPPPSRRA